MEANEYLEDIKSRLIASNAIAAFTIVEELDFGDRGYFRARVTLSNDDFLEVAEYFKITDNVVATTRYRYQWMDCDRSILRKRWDNVPHFPNLPNFPHHIHVESEENVISGNSLNIQELLDILEQEIEF
ncbi:MAG: DUF6516 family protein [Pseudanabaena sp. ELA748]